MNDAKQQFEEMLRMLQMSDGEFSDYVTKMTGHAIAFTKHLQKYHDESDLTMMEMLSMMGTCLVETLESQGISEEVLDGGFLVLRDIFLEARRNRVGDMCESKTDS